MTTPIQTALCSYGMSGRVFHAPLLHVHPGFALTYILQRSKQDAKDRFPDIEIKRNLAELLAVEEIELVVVNTPEPTHFPFAKQALEAGKHVVVEKAFTPTAAEAEELVDLAKTHNRLISVYQNRRWDSDFLTVQHVIRERMLGRLVEYEAHYDRYRNYIQTGTWKEEQQPGAGILFNLGSHLIDQALSLFGMPERVFADIQIQRTGGRVPDHFEIILFYPKMKATLRAGYLVREPGPKYILHGTEGSFQKYGLDTQEQALKEGVWPGNPGWGEEPEEIWGTLNTQVNGLHVRGKVESLKGNYLAYYDNIHAAIRHDQALIVSGEDGLKVIQIIEAAQESAARGIIVDIGA